MRDADELVEKSGIEYIVSVPKNENIISMCVADDILFIATDKHVYQLMDGKRLHKVQ